MEKQGVRGLYIVFFICLPWFSCYGQSPIKTHNHQDLLWFGYFPKFQIGKNWAIDLDFQFRRREWGREWSQIVARQGVSYQLSENINFSAGFAYLQQYKTEFIQKEYRPFQQLIILNNILGIKLDHRYRFEQRWLQRIQDNQLVDGYFFNYRIRYKVAVGVPIKLKSQPTAWSIYADNEMMINFGEEIFINLFDQNRFSFGLNYQLNKNLRLQLGYMNIYAQKSRLGEFDDVNIIRLNIYQKFALPIL